MTETMVRDISRAVHEEGGESVCFMSTPAVVENFSKYLFTSSARVAALYSDVKEKSGAATATGAANVFVSDFSTLKLVSNRIQQAEDATHTNAFLIDPDYLRMAKLHGYRTEPLAKQGLADNRQIAVDWTLCVMNELAQGLIEGIDPSEAVTES